MDIKRKNRKVLRASFTKEANELEEYLNTVPLIVSDLELSWECLKPKWDSLTACEKEIYNMMLEEDATEEQLLSNMNQCEVYLKRFTGIKLRVRKCLEKPVADHDNNRSEVENREITKGRRKFQLPQIQFKQYDGNIRDWLSFWSQFKKVHVDSEIDDCDKIEYLLQATVSGSRARQIVESFPNLDENYEKIVECMKTRFGREDLQIESYVRELLKLVLNVNVSSERKFELVRLYDQIETQLRALDTLGITSDKYAALLFPLIESCLPSELLRVWQRSPCNSSRNIDNENINSDAQSIHSYVSNDSPLEIRLRNLMQFLRLEVENEQRIDLASEGFGLVENEKSRSVRSTSDKKSFRDSVPAKMMTAAGLVNTDVARCIFCSGNHGSDQCFKAQNMTFDERKIILIEKKACFKCLKIGHSARKCRTRLKCLVCGYQHVPLMCQNLLIKKQCKIQDDVLKVNDMTNQTSTHVFLQTLRINVRGANGTRFVRALIDTGSQRSYILKSTVSLLNLKPKRAEKITHCLFGGTEIENTHYCYDVTIFNSNYSYTFEVLDQQNICNEVSSVFYGPWMKELTSLNVEVSDVHSQGSVEILLGADVVGMLYTGKRHILNCGLVANETYVGWTLEGKVPIPKSHSMTVTMSMLVNPSIGELWQLDVLGIEEPLEKKTRHEMAMAAKELFNETIIINQEGRYEVRLPWISDHPALPTNYVIAKRRLANTLEKLDKQNMTLRYSEVFKEWENLKIIEKTDADHSQGHFLPHRPVIKEGSTTAIRPVFDASAHEKDGPSLNRCLEKGENLIEKIPTILSRFREHEIGVISDIKKAFLQISINPKDRQVLKFLWLDEEEQEVVYRHRRVVFGINCSPFLLGATIDHHLSKCIENCLVHGCAYSRETIEKLRTSFYVDNCVTSVSSQDVLNTFVEESVQAMKEAEFELRGWEFSGGSRSRDSCVSVLGLKWFPNKDVLTINADLLQVETENMIMTKRKLLSMAQKVFDLIGFTSPATLQPKLWLQMLWKENVSWDTEVDNEFVVPFKNWMKDLQNLIKIEIPRCNKIGNTEQNKISIHTFVDASKYAYAAAVYSRVIYDNKVWVYLLAAKSRVAPIEKDNKRLTIPRLELLAATIGARLYTQVTDTISGIYESYFWSDSTTVISWIQRNEEWGTFVYNRVNEIRKLTRQSQWCHIPGIYNAADLPSRGCTPKQLVESKWWEGPNWLYRDEKMWPYTKDLQIDEEEIDVERKKKSVKTLLNLKQDKTDYHWNRFSSFEKTVRMIASMFRFIYNLTHKKKNNERRSGSLTVKELEESEQFILKQVQEDSLEEQHLKSLNPFYDDYGLLRLKSRVSNRPDEKVGYRFSIILPKKHPVVDSLILDRHKRSSHVGVQGLLAMLRENYWVIGGRRSIKSVVKRCTICRRFDAKPFVVEAPPLPADRVRNSVPFAITGVDFAGPLFLRSGEKAWICLFTCAVYRCVHLELTLSLSTNGFLQVLRRFSARRGRPKVMYSDNGTNFQGTENAFRNLNWDNIQHETSVQRIVWKFNPPTASWWGGFFERLIGLVKILLRKVLGKACLDYEELLTLIVDCEAVVNARPLTYVSSDPADLLPLTPAIFLCEQSDGRMPDVDEIERVSFSRSLREKQRLRELLRQRFRLEYLGELKLFSKKKPSVSVRLDQIVLLGNDFTKRIDWPLGRVIEIIPGKDGRVRLVRVKTKRGELLRPVQCLYPLECDVETSSGLVPVEQADDEENQKPNSELDLQGDAESLGTQNTEVKTRDTRVIKSRVPVTEICVESVKNKITRSGRNVKMPQRFGQ